MKRTVIKKPQAFRHIQHNTTELSLKYFPKITEHYHSGIEIIYLLKGKLKITTNNKEYILSPGDACIANYSESHSIEPVSETSTHHLFQISTAFTEENYLSGIIFDTFVESPVISDLCLSLADSFSSPEPLRNATIRSAALTLLLELAKNHSVPAPQEEKKISPHSVETSVWNSIWYINKNYRNPITIDELVKACNYSRSYFSTQFKIITGMSIIDYINNLRCLDAKSLLGTTNKSISEISEICGFHNLSYFTRTYVKHMGMRPSETRSSSK